MRSSPIPSSALLLCAFSLLSLNPGLGHIILFSCFVISQHLLMNRKDLIFQNIFLTAVITPAFYIERNILAEIQQTCMEQLPWAGKPGQEEGYPPFLVWLELGEGSRHVHGAPIGQTTVEMKREGQSLRGRKGKPWALTVYHVLSGIMFRALAICVFRQDWTGYTLAIAWRRALQSQTVSIKLPDHGKV